MFGNINKNNKNYAYKPDMNDNSQSSRIRTNRPINRPQYSNRSSRYEEATYSLSSEEDSEESHRSIRKLKPNNINTINHSKTPRIDELELVKKENIELKLRNEFLIKLNILSESIVKNSNLMMDISNEQKSINARLEKLESEPNNNTQITAVNMEQIKNINSKLLQESDQKSVLANEIIVINSRLEKLENKIVNDADILSIGDNSSVDVSANNSSSDISKPLDDLIIESGGILFKLPKLDKK